LKSKVEGLNVLMDNMRQQIADLLANGGVTPALQAQIDEVFTEAKGLADEITVAVDENAPPAPPPEEPTA
jgi:predicted component of type VI protein secretion system